MTQAERLRKKQERLRSFTDEQTLAATEAAAEKTKLAEELAKRTSGDRKAEENLRQAVTNAEKENLKLNDKLAQVLSEKETLNTELRTIAAEVGDVKVRTSPPPPCLLGLQNNSGNPYAQSSFSDGMFVDLTAFCVFVRTNDRRAG